MNLFVLLPSITFEVHGLSFSIYSCASSSGIVELQITLTFILYYYHNQNPCLLLGSCLVLRNYDSMLRFRRLCKTHFSHLGLVLFIHYEVPSWLGYQTQGIVIINTGNKVRLELYLGVFN